MDKVQIYYAAVLALGIVASFSMDGKPKTLTEHSFKMDMLSILFTLPIIGRVFLWW